MEFSKENEIGIMSYELRLITEEDKELFLKCGLESPFGANHIGFGRYIVDNVTEDIKMVHIGGQGILTEKGEEWSEMPEYCAVIWRRIYYLVEFYSRKETIEKKENYNVFNATYKIKFVHTQQKDKKIQQEFVKRLKECFVVYNTKRYKNSLCDKVSFMDTEVRWK